MECPVCYENCANCTLVCGHKFCKTCVKTWYLKGSDGGCPMCRRKVHYRRMPVNKWRKEAEESKKESVFQESFNELLESVMEPMVFSIPEGHSGEIPNVNMNRYIPVVNGDTLTIHRKNVSLAEFADLEKTYRAIKDECSPDELDYVLNDTDEYYSDRLVHLKNRRYSENGHIYPPLKRMDSVKMSKKNARRS